MKRLLVLGSFAVAAVSQATVVYDNINAPATTAAGTSSADLLQTWGDQVTLASTGKLSAMRFSLFNSTTGGNTGTVATATVNIRIYDVSNATGGGAYASGALTAKPLLGNFNANINFGANPLPAGFFSIITVSGLSAFNINLTSNVMVTQQVTTFTGGSLRLGVVAQSQDNVGAQWGADAFYRKTGATEGLVSFAAGGPPNRLAYTLEVVPEPASIAVLGLGFAALLRRRRK